LTFICQFERKLILAVKTIKIRNKIVK